jgi:hypothetical protein
MLPGANDGVLWDKSILDANMYGDFRPYCMSEPMRLRLLSNWRSNLPNGRSAQSATPTITPPHQIRDTSGVDRHQGCLTAKQPRAPLEARIHVSFSELFTGYSHALRR